MVTASVTGTTLTLTAADGDRDVDACGPRWPPASDDPERERHRGRTPPEVAACSVMYFTSATSLSDWEILN